MYYSYKSKKRTKIRYKFIIFLLIISCLSYLGYRYQSYLLFWKYTYNKLTQNLKKVEKIENKIQKKNELIKLSNILEEYKNENQASPDAYNISGKVYYMLAELSLYGTFSEIIIHNRMKDIDYKSKKMFIKAIKDFKRAMALGEDNEVKNDYTLKLAMSYYYTGYYKLESIYKIIEHINQFDTKKQVEYIRFCSLVNIQIGETDRGLGLLKNGINSNDQEHKLFSAVASKLAGRFTDSILEFKQILDKTADKKIVKLINQNLGEIYYNQGLHKESIFHFTNALKIDKRDNQLKIWIGKNYSSIGLKTKAKAIWNEVLISDRDNVEAKKLLGMM